KSPWTAIYVENHKHYRLTREGQEAVERTLRLAERMGGDTEIVQGQNAQEDILAYAHSKGFTKIIVGKTPKPRWKEVLSGTLADQLIRGSGNIDVYVVTGGDEDRKALHSPFWKTNTPWQYYFSAPAATALCTLALIPLRDYLDPANMVMVYLIGVVGIALRYGRGPSFLTTCLSALCLNFFFLEPYYELKVSEEQEIITFIVLMLTGIIIGTQNSRLRMRAISARSAKKTPTPCLP
ncbi:MAG: DUF4118 domain-containing protein, partial [Rickettsiales bacterium]|nr:DUF4118 domain-containing protein [Rickettsiales bacterium]